MDFSKAFDKVNHQVIAWIEDFLTGRQQKAIVEGEESSVANVTSGVPQGSVIGPTMFLYYIND